ncbi:MAG: NAD(P)-dependent oxidoreductase [Ruthenibacterium lactatiformans]
MCAQRAQVGGKYIPKNGDVPQDCGCDRLGKTGSEVARLVKSFDMKVLAWTAAARGTKRRSRSTVPKTARLNELLAQCDYVVLSWAERSDFPLSMRLNWQP